MSNDFQIDDADRAIVEQLRLNGRATNQQIANTLGLTAATVSARIRRMEDANKLRVVAVSDFSAHGYNVLMEVAIEVDGRPAIDVVEELVQFPEVFAAHLVTGRYALDLHPGPLRLAAPGHLPAKAGLEPIAGPHPELLRGGLAEQHAAQALGEFGAQEYHAPAHPGRHAVAKPLYQRTISEHRTTPAVKGAQHAGFASGGIGADCGVFYPGCCWRLR